MPDDGKHYELYDGELVVVPSPMPRHEIVRGRLYEILIGYRRAHGGMICDPYENRLECSALRDGRYSEPVVAGSGTFESSTIAGLAVNVDDLFLGLT